ncbi:MAG: NADH oxidase H2O2-forming [Candidatus Phytoplasma cynodontis]|uniref:FAD-dependent oxidoreductase n=1 Tax='Cynodon dactylon' phytoplasma TaxID=295320 RepID=UPI001265D012|nr:FAD-dependent oxidoreductase ['Cynodon dactylon' phytoplasma]KAB8121712.1 SidA/IucD/PvdA family monooxygenase ['Cynodon dactylon' phytoplasma]WIA07705.1 MAG: NADH oxidase H2O2-forming [Candidatus Phytoplasma cynodontis]
MKVIIIGCTHAGTTAAKTILKRNEDVQISIYEKNDNVSFLSCGIALYIGGVVKDKKGLFYSNSEELKQMGANIKLKHEVLNIDFVKKEILVKDLEKNKEFIDNFDKLVISMGSWPIIPQIEGVNCNNVLLSKNFEHANKIIEYAKNIKKIVVIGAGYIGVELAESFAKQNKDVVLIDTQDRIMSKYLDKEFTDIAEKTLLENNVKLMLGQKVSDFKIKNGLVTHVKTDKGCYETELVIMCISFKPNTELVQPYLKTSSNGALIVNSFLQTSNPDVYACGDCTNIFYNPTQEYNYIPLATNAVRMGTIIGLNIKENNQKYLGTQGTSGIKIFDLSISSTGLTEYVAKSLNINYGVIKIKDANRPEFMPDYDSVFLKVIFNKNTKQILGGQILSTIDMTEKINTLSVCIQKKMTIDELAFVDFFFHPYFNKPFSLLNLAGLKYLETFSEKK